MGVLEKDPGLQEGDLEELRQLWYKLLKIGQKAKENNIILYVDAEHTWYQPALDAYTLLLSQEFNRPPTSKGKIWTGPLIYGTYQSYLCRQPTHLIRAIQHAEANGYALGVKLVRGAYFEQERKKWSDDGRIGADPIWPSKAATDVSYNGSISVIMTTLASQLKSPHPELALSVAFGTHNPESCDLICENLLKNDLAKEVGETKMLRLRQDVRGKVRIAQLLGMKDDLTDRMASKFVNDGKPVALKYMAYGKLSEVMPYLGRRAIENKSLMSGDQGAAAEMGRVAAELKRRFFGGSV
ncbi:proline dehydrogenase [Cryptococcus deuterogattii R265]|nr:proline dehydrogenase [Cryptococcus deuterogattii R265]